jgi:hypothetical protein
MSKDQLELIPKSVAEKLEHHAANISLFIAGNRKGAAEQFGYAYLAGREMLAAKPVVPHGNNGNANGGFQRWVQARWPKLPYRTAACWMLFADAINSHVGVTQLLKEKPLLLKKGRLTVKDRATILQAVPLVMDGKSMTRFMRDSRLLRDPEKPQHHPRKKIAPDKALAAKHKQAVKHWTCIMGDLNLGAGLAKYLPDDTRASAARELLKYIPCLSTGLPGKHTQEVIGILVDTTAVLRKSLTK